VPRVPAAPVIRIRHPPDRRSRIQHWNDTIAALTELQVEYGGWLDALPDNQQDSATAEALRAIVELDLSELWRSSHRVVSAVIEQRDGLTDIGHDDAWKGGRHQPVAV
jgi:hypothetical protein